MILLALGLLAFGVADLIRGRLERGPRGEGNGDSKRAGLGVAGGVAAAAAVAVLAGSSVEEAAVIAVVAAVALGLWVVLDWKFGGAEPLVPLAWITGVLLALFASSSLGQPVEGPLGDWYMALDFGFTSEVEADQFLLGCGAVLFAVASCNRMVVLVLALTGTSLKPGDSRLNGGRFLGPMERIIVGAVILGGDPAAAAIVIAAKGLLRFPEIRQNEERLDPQEERLSPDAITEYFLIGTVTSLLLASVLAICVSAAS